MEQARDPPDSCKTPDVVLTSTWRLMALNNITGLRNVLIIEVACIGPAGVNISGVISPVRSNHEVP